MQRIDKLLMPFAKSIAIKSKALSNKSLQLTKIEQSRFLESISDDIRKASDLIPPKIISKKAKQKANRMKFDLLSKCWQDQTKFDHGRKVFHLEHIIPVRELREMCLSGKSVSSILKTLVGIEVAWILKVEDQELTRRGYRQKRTDPKKAYKEAGIELLYGPCKA